MTNATKCKKKYRTWYLLTHPCTFNNGTTVWRDMKKKLTPTPPPPPKKSLIQHLGHPSGVLDTGTKLVLSTSTTRSAATLDTKTF